MAKRGIGAVWQVTAVGIEHLRARGMLPETGGEGRRAMGELKVYTNGVEWVVARDAADIRDALMVTYGPGGEGSADEATAPDADPWRELAADAVVKIRREDAPPRGPSAKVVCADAEPTHDVRTAAEWAALNGRGLLCSTEA